MCSTGGREGKRKGGMGARRRFAILLLAETIYEQRSFKLLAINTGYWLAAVVGSGVLLAVWH